MRKLYNLLLALIVIIPCRVLANQSITATSNIFSALKENFKYAGYIDGSYNYLVRSNEFTSGTFDRVFDITRNGVTLQQTSLVLSSQPKEGLGFLINPIIGRDPYTFAPYGWDPTYGGQWLGFAIPQAYLQYAIGSLTLMGGSFVELAGAESLFPINDTNFSRGILYGYAEPFTVFGLRAAYTVNDKLNFVFGVDNGWDSIRDYSRRKIIELNATYTPSSLFSFAATGYSGGQRAADKIATGSESRRYLIDIVATLNATKKLAFVANYDYGNQTLAALPFGNVAEAVWHGIAGYINYTFNDKWQTSFRGEIFSDRNGYRTGVVQAWKELTLTVGYIPIKNLILRAETRHDFSNVSSFVNGNGVGSNNNQQSYALEGLYKFG